MTGAALRLLAWHALPPRIEEGGTNLAAVNAGAAETVLWLQPAPAAAPTDSREARRATRPATLLLRFAQAWSAGRHAADLTAWAGVAEAWTAMPPGRDADGDAAEDSVVALLLLRRDGALPLLREDLLARVLDRLLRGVDHSLRHPPPAGSDGSQSLYAAWLAAAVLGPALPRRGRLLAATRARQARELLVARLGADFQADGSHCEYLPQRHRRALHTALCFVAVARALDETLPPPLHARLRAALEFSLWSTLPDGGLPGTAPDVPANQALLALGAALYWLPSLEFAASGGGRGDPPAALARHFAHAGRLVARSSWHDAQAQHLVVDHGPRPSGGPLAFSYAIGGQRVLVDPGLPNAPGAPQPPAVVRLGARSIVLRAGATDTPGTVRTRCLAYVLNQYVLRVDRVQAEDDGAHPACFTLQFAGGWQDRLALAQDARGIVVRGMADRPGGDWQLRLAVPASDVELAAGSDAGGPTLQARHACHGESFAAVAIGPHGSDFALHGLEAQHGAGRSVVCVSGESGGEPFVDRLVVHWQEPGLVMRPDYLARATLALERRSAGRLQHLLLAEADDWFSCLRPVHAAQAPDAAGDLEW